MTKRKDHLIDIDAAVQSVLLGGTASAACGMEKVWTREDFEPTEYRDTCKHCMAAVAAKSSPEPMSILPKIGWTALVERAWKSRYDESRRISYTVQWSPVGTYAAWTPKASPSP